MYTGKLSINAVAEMKKVSKGIKKNLKTVIANLELKTVERTRKSSRLKEMKEGNRLVGTFITFFRKSATTVCVREGGTQDNIFVPKQTKHNKTFKK